MKTEKWFQDGDKVIHQKTTDPNPSLNRAAMLRGADKTTLGESWHIGSIDQHVLETWIKDAGLRFDDRAAIRDLIKTKLLDSDNKLMRVHSGTY